MKKGLPNKSRVATVSRMRKSAMMGAAATALIAAAPTFSADASPTRQRRCRQPSGASCGRQRGSPHGARLSSRRRELPPDSARSSSATATTSPSAPTKRRSASESVEDISLVNTGDLTGGIGIDVSTGANDLADAMSDQTSSYVFGGNYEYRSSTTPAIPSTAQMATSRRSRRPRSPINIRATILEPDPLESTISIDNSGSIAFSGLQRHPGDQPGRRVDRHRQFRRHHLDAGHRVPVRHLRLDGNIRPVGSPRPRPRPATSPTTPTASSRASTRPTSSRSTTSPVDMEYDAGVISIQNSGNIDMGAVAGRPVSTARASSRRRASPRGATAARPSSTPATSRSTSGAPASMPPRRRRPRSSTAGRIDIGNLSSGISFGPSRGSAGDYRLGGDVYILNTGEIHGGVTRDEGDPAVRRAATGINVFSLGSNNEYLAAQAHVNEIFAQLQRAAGLRRPSSSSTSRTPGCTTRRS